MIEALRRTWVRFALAGVAAYLVFLLVNLPASWLGYALERASGGAIALGAPGGTVWKGRGTIAARSGSGFKSLADVEWRCNPLSIFTGALAVTVSGDAPGASLKGNLRLGVRSVRLEKVDATVPLALVEAAVPLVSIWKPEGRVRVVADSLEIGRGSVRGAATVEWAEAGLSGVARVGDYRLQITGAGDRAGLKLSTQRGDLRMNGDGEWRADQPRQIQLRGIANASPARKDLEPLLAMIAGEGQGSSRQFGWMMTL